MQADKPLAMRTTPIPGVLIFDIPVFGDSRGWFKENWQRAKMLAAGLPDFGPVQNSISFNESVGTTRGIHAEPWDKFISIGHGRVFGAWVDLREGDSFGAVFTAELDPSVAIFIPRGVGNSFQTLEPQTTYTYLVNEHWNAESQSLYTFLNLADETVAIDWPIPLSESELSQKDLNHPRLSEIAPMPSKKTLILGANGQVGRALRELFPDADAFGHAEFDITNPSDYDTVEWTLYDTLINAAAYTAVDEAETLDGRRRAWATNVTATSQMARVATANRLTLVHISTDYVFDGELESHGEDEPHTPLGVYAQSKAAADSIVATVPRHYIVRTSWVVGDGANFVRTMASLAQRGINPSVVEDQVGRLSFADDIAEGIHHLLASKSPYGVYNLTNEGETVTWADIARDVFSLTGADPDRVTGVTTAEYFAGKAIAPRPLNSVLVLDKIRATGFVPRDAKEALREYLA
ncbi:bifunctional dTDP-4-dehydrorhamnose 3,5-epimerase family protein/NAD(P)-dependent oxidoreductase [Glaciihabitans sp. dw_435]|uniref:sugar nucleotide-binding protein n=1 Tax=Glaciihabitans sp. dw_435 TaxID=2720081 RepID=UPI001BD40D7A|nr:bifunctional dTDP-4-dehydrorhamnose 3,5-epimerase family protein/NAD(P)-dependent oxidoreductase [Glaciihabitans sp. dw_435]